MRPVIVKQDRDTKQVLRVIEPSDPYNITASLYRLKQRDVNNFYHYLVFYVDFDN